MISSYRSLELAPTRFDRFASRYAIALTIRWDSIAPNLLEDGYDIGIVEEGLGPKDAVKTMIYTHVLKRGSPRGQESSRTHCGSRNFDLYGSAYNRLGHTTIGKLLTTST